jgi:hypothetical protein
MSGTGEIREHMEVVGADGGHVGTVDRLERGHIRLTRRDDPDGSGQHHHAIPLRAIRMVEGDRVWLTLPAQQARALAVGGLPPEAMEEGTTDTADEAGASPDKVSVSDMAGQAGNGTGMIHGGGTTAGRTGTGGGRAHGGGTGGGGTSAGHLGGGAGFADDPNMDPSGRGDPEL